MIRLILVFILIISNLCLFYAQHEIPFIDGSINADGHLDEQSWSHAVTYSQFHNFFPINEGMADLDTDVKIFTSATHLNIAIIYHDTTSAVRVNSLKRDKYYEGFHLSDHVGIIIDPYRTHNIGYYFALNGEGSKLDALIVDYDNTNLSWDAIWTAGTRVNGTDKIYEFSIPLSVISSDEQADQWNFQFYNRDSRAQLYTVKFPFDRGFLQYDVRFLQPLTFERLERVKSNRSIITPSLTFSHRHDAMTDSDDTKLTPSLDAQYKINDGLRIDATVNPDFSQIDVDEQVVNLTRFSIVFPERRNFFIENSDIFSTLGATDNINPFYSRFIGARRDVNFGVKLSGNVSPKTRIGLLNVQADKEQFDQAENYTVAVAKHQLTQNWNTTAYFINTQENDGFDFNSDKYNRVAGIKTNYLSKNRKWSGLGMLSQTYSPNTDDKNLAFAVENNYQTRKTRFSTRVSGAGTNYHTSIGFVPRLQSYDPVSNTVIREGYTQFYQSLELWRYPDGGKIDAHRYVKADVRLSLDEQNDFNEINLFYNNAIWFTNLASIYTNVYHDRVKLKYPFSPAGSPYVIVPDTYDNTAIRIGYNSRSNGNIFGNTNLQYGSFYGGNRRRFAAGIGYRRLPLLTLEASYEFNQLVFDPSDNINVQLLGFRSEVFLSNALNWTTYFQYNEQAKNVNINSRVQWEYKPLSFIYLVVSNNYNNDFVTKDWTVSMKINRRFSL